MTFRSEGKIHIKMMWKYIAELSTWANEKSMWDMEAITKKKSYFL